MRKFDSRHSTSKTMIVVAASLALGTAMMATATLAFARGGSRGHFGGSGHFGGGFDGGHFAGRHFGRGFGGDFGRLYGFGGDGLYYGETAIAVATSLRLMATPGPATEAG